MNSSIVEQSITRQMEAGFIVWHKMRNFIGRAIHVIQRPPIKRPVFIIGCGRSGTTILGRSLSNHPQVTYLNEPRHLWVACYPETDIWSSHAAARGGKLALTEADVRESGTKQLRNLFQQETFKTGREVLVEKLPANNFRLPFIWAIFPDARFLYLTRNGFEVARSIEQIASRRPWYGHAGYKWDQIVSYIDQQYPHLLPLLPLCENNYERGLLEWRLSMEVISRFQQANPTLPCLELSYNDLMESPVAVMSKIFDHLELDRSITVNKFVLKNLRRRTVKEKRTKCSEKEFMIAGPFLE